MGSEDRILQLMESLQSDVAAIRRDVNSTNTQMHLMEYALQALKDGYGVTRSDVTRIQLAMEEVRPTQANIMEHTDIINASVMNLENNTMRELRLLNENLPDVMERREQIVEMATTVEEHDHRIFALEQKVANG